MPPYIFANDAITALDGSIDDSQTTIDVVDAAVFQHPGAGLGQFVVRIDDELILVTDIVSSNQLTVTRGHESTTPAAHADSAEVRMAMSKDALENFCDQRTQIGAGEGHVVEAHSSVILGGHDNQIHNMSYVVIMGEEGRSGDSYTYSATPLTSVGMANGDLIQSVATDPAWMASYFDYYGSGKTQIHRFAVNGGVLPLPNAEAGPRSFYLRAADNGAIRLQSAKSYYVEITLMIAASDDYSRGIYRITADLSLQYLYAQNQEHLMGTYDNDDFTVTLSIDGDELKILVEVDWDEEIYYWAHVHAIGRVEVLECITNMGA